MGTVLSTLPHRRYVELRTWYGRNREVIDFGTLIGVYRNEKTAQSQYTTRGTIHYSKSGAHVVPAPPHPPSAGKR